MSHRLIVALRAPLAPDRRRFARRGFLGLGVAAASAVSGLGHARNSRTAIDGFRTLDLKLDGDPRVSNRALVLVPETLDPTKKHRSVVLLHGYGQAHRVPSALDAWWRHYGGAEAHRRLQAPPLRRARSSVWYWDPQRIDDINAELSTHPFEGLVLICPVTPIPYFVRGAFSKFSSWVEKTLLPTVRDKVPIGTDAASTGLAGHSMGGNVALELLIRKPHLFGSFSGVQLEVAKKKSWRYAARLAAALEGQDQPKIQLHTATRDPYRNEIVKLHRHLEKKDVASELRKSWGAHNRLWMQELGSVETLLWHDRTLEAPASL